MLLHLVTLTALAGATLAQPSITARPSTATARPSSASARPATASAAPSAVPSAAPVVPVVPSSPTATGPIPQVVQGIPGVPLTLPNAARYPPLDIPVEATDAFQPWTAKFGTVGGVQDVPVTNCVNPTNFAMTFDDGPADGTVALLDAFKARNIKVTFFVVGSRVITNPALLKRAYDDGHQIGIHTWSHANLTLLTNAQIVAELMLTARAVREVVGVTPKYWRPPYGSVNPAVLAIAKNLGMVTSLWSDDSGDAAGSLTVVQSMTGFAAGPKRGPITLQHDLTAVEGTYGAPSADAVIAAGYKVSRMDECIGITAYDESVWAGFPGNGVLAPFGAGLSAVPSPTAASNTPVTGSGAGGNTGSGSGSGNNNGNSPIVASKNAAHAAAGSRLFDAAALMFGVMAAALAL